MKTYVLLHFEHKNDVTIIIKLHRATRLRFVALYKRLTMIVTLICMFTNVIKHRFSWNKCQIDNSLLFREPPTSVFQHYFHSLKFLTVLLLMLLLS